MGTLLWVQSKLKKYTNSTPTGAEQGDGKAGQGDGAAGNLAAKSPHYKVVCVRRSKLDSVYGFEVYSPESGHWRKPGEKLRAQVDFENGVYWNGSIHWMGAADSWYLNLDAQQVLDKMPMPPMRDGPDGRSNSYFGECCGHLHYAQIILGPRIQFDVHEMKRDYSWWFVKYRVDLLHPGIIGCYQNEVSVFSMVRGERADDSFLVLQIPGELIRCNLVSRTLKLIRKSERVTWI